MNVKIARGHKINDRIQIGNNMYKINQFIEDCREECDIDQTSLCRKIACNAYDRLDNRSIAFELLGRIDTPYDEY